MSGFIHRLADFGRRISTKPHRHATSEPRWVAWHRAYDAPGSDLQRRLAVVRDEIRRVLDSQDGRRTRIISICAGQGRDLIGVLAEHPAGQRVAGRLVERDPENAAVARAAALAAGLSEISVTIGDAGTTDAYIGAVPADLVLICGVFGHVSEEDIARTIALLPQLCARDAGVIWTKGRHTQPDMTPMIRHCFETHRFPEIAFHGPEDAEFGVGVNRFVGAPSSLQSGTRLFTFTG